MGKQAFYGMSDMEFGKAVEYSNEMFAALCVSKDAVEGLENEIIFYWSGREDLNLRLRAPKAGALPGCATPR